MSNNFELENIYRVYDNNHGTCIELRPHPDNIGEVDFFELHTPDEKSKEWYGDISISLTIEQVRLLGEAFMKIVNNK